VLVKVMVMGTALEGELAAKPEPVTATKERGGPLAGLAETCAGAGIR
jgi:hypothetical protein